MEIFYLADGSDFIQSIESTTARSAECGGDEERVKSVLDVLHHGFLQPVPPENTLVVRLEDPQLDKSNHGGFLHTRMSFLWMKTNLVFITFLALLIVIKRTGAEVIQISTLLLEYYYGPLSSHTTTTDRVLYLVLSTISLCDLVTHSLSTTNDIII